MTIYFPPPLRHEPGTIHPWAVLRIKAGRVQLRRELPPRVGTFLCRIGLHFMARNFALDANACECRKQILCNEDIR